MPQFAPIFKSAVGLAQFQKGQKALSKLERPTYQIPEGLKQRMSAAEIEALEGLPEESVRQYVSNIERAGQTALKAKRGQRGVGDFFQQQKDAFSELMAMDVEARKQGRQQLREERGIMAGQEQLQFQINKMQPYLQQLQQAQAMAQAGQQQVFEGGLEMFQGIDRDVQQLGSFAAGGGMGA